MTRHQPRSDGSLRWLACCAVLASAALGPAAQGDTITMTSGMVYRSLGKPDKDNTLVFMSDGLKRVVVRDSKILRIEADNSFRGGERFQLVQPLSKHAGLMPEAVIAVNAGSWDARGRRSFSYVGANGKRISMEQAIIEIGPHICKFRGVDGFWVSQVATESVPRQVIVGLLSRVERKNLEERERVARFLMEVGWFAEAQKALDDLALDFPKKDLQERVAGAKAYLYAREAELKLLEVEALRSSRQPGGALAVLRSIDENKVGTELALRVRDLVRRLDQERADDVALAADLRTLAAAIPGADRAYWKGPLLEVLAALDQAPDAVRDRLAAWRKVKNDKKIPATEQFALAMSGYVVGYEKAVRELKVARAYWEGRGLLLSELRRTDLAEQSETAARLAGLDWSGDGKPVSPAAILDLLTRMVPLMPPPAHDEEFAVPGKLVTHRAPHPENEAPTEYMVHLPPEYHPLRSYPLLVVLHSGQGPRADLEMWVKEADRRGFIVVAPEYSSHRGSRFTYDYTPSEHAAVELAVRDARKRYAVDSDRIFLAGMLEGGNMAWDLALAHPDLFAGVTVISGYPARFVPRYLSHHERMPLFLVLGDLVPAVEEFLYGKYIKPLILKAWDVTYTEYYRRGLELLPEEIPNALDWMSRRKRNPYPRSFEVVTGRSCDVRFHGLVIKEFAQGRAIAPEAIDALGQNLKPALIKVKSSALSNTMIIQAEGVKRMDVWLSPRMFDFSRRLEVRINKTPYYKQARVKLELEPMLEDLRIRGDRSQIYWYRVSAG